MIANVGRSTIINVLHLDRSPSDSGRVGECLLNAAIHHRIDRVETHEDFTHALENGTYDLILVDHAPPSVDGLSILVVARDRTPETPFVVVSATLDEEAVIECLKLGATDYVSKRHLERLPLVVTRALREAGERLQLLEAKDALRNALARAKTKAVELKRAEILAEASEERLRLVTGALPVLICYVDAGQRYRFNNKAYQDWFGCGPDEIYGRHVSDVIGTEAYTVLKPHIETALSGQRVTIETLTPYKHGGPRYTRIEYAPDAGSDGRIRGYYALIEDLTERRRTEETLREETRTLEILNRTGAALAAELHLDRLVQTVTDAGTELAGAQFGAFFYNVVNQSGESYMLYTLSGVPRESFANFPMPRNTAVFGPTFRGEKVIRADDITKDRRYGKNAPHHGMPKGHLPVRSYLAAPVVSRSGEVLGGLFFGHAKPGVFTERVERIITGIAAQAAVAIDNARLYQDAQREIAERKRAEGYQQLLLAELSHRVKNTLASVISIATQTLEASPTLEAFRNAFGARLLALAQTHDLLSEGNWRSTDLRDVILAVLRPFTADGAAPRVTLGGAAVALAPRAALSLGLAFHELATNAAKYGALSVPTGRVEIFWSVRRGGGEDRLSLCWSESDGPGVRPPGRRGFGSTLVERGLAHELDGEVQLVFEPTGVRCEIEIPLTGEPAADPIGGQSDMARAARSRSTADDEPGGLA